MTDRPLSFQKGEPEPKKSRAMIRRSTKRIKRGGRPKAKKRKPSEYARIYGSKARVEWVKRRPCRGCWGPFESENHHIESGGVGRKADYTKIIPLCSQCHHEWHRHGRATFEAKHRMNGELAAQQLEELWQRTATNTA